MKKSLYSLIFIFILFPMFVKAETITFDVCDTCEYNFFSKVTRELDNIEDITNMDVIININSLYVSGYNIGSIDHMPKSITINGNEYEWDRYTDIYAKSVTLNDVKANAEIDVINAEKIVINNTKLKWFFIEYVNEDGSLSSKEINLYNTLEIDKPSLESIQAFIIAGNIKISDINLNNSVVVPFGGNIKIYNSTLSKVTSAPMVDNLNVDIYNSTFKTLKYKSIISSTDENINDLVNLLQNYDLESVEYDVYDVNANVPGFGSMNGTSNTTVYFDKEAEIKINDKINLVDYLDYYTEDKEISYTIENQSIAKIDNKELIGLKPGQTRVQVTTDDGHVVYNIDLTVYTISEKKVTMRAQNKLKLNSVFKDLDISSISDDVWEISNPKVAKIVNGEIVSLSKGETDIVAIINGVKYIYHLTVSDTLVSKEIKVPITGKSIKLWIVIVGILLLSVIGTCTYLLIKKK